jgi:hypothetical protein
MSGLKNAHARRTLALFTHARALHLRLSPAAVAEAAGVSRSDAVNAVNNAGVSFEAAERLFAWNGLDLARVLASAPGRRMAGQKTAAMGFAEPLRISDFKHVFAKGACP